MNSNRQFDEHINEQFNNYSPDVHPRIWEKIIAEKDKKRPAGFWVSMFNNRNKLLVLGLIITLSSGGAWIYYNKNFTPKFSQTTVENKLVFTRPVNKNNTRESNQPADQKLNSPNLNTGQLTTKNNTALNTNQHLSSTGGIKVRIYSPALQAEDDEKNTVKTGNQNKKYYTGLGNVLVNITSPELADDEYEGQGTLLGRLNFNAEKYAIKRKTEKPQTLSFNPIIFLPDCPIEKDAAGNKRYFEFYAGPDYAFRSLQDTANSAYLQKRKESTKFKSGYSAGVRYTKVFNNSMSVRGGVNYSQINEKFTFNQGNIIQVTYIINNNGDTIGSYTTKRSSSARTLTPTITM